MTKESELEYTLASGKVVTVRYEAEYSVVDNGIGAYEYWGALGRDVQLDTECDDSNVTFVEDEDGECIWNTLSKEEQQAIEQAAYDHACENCPEVEECSDDGYYEDPRDWD